MRLAVRAAWLRAVGDGAPLALTLVMKKHSRKLSLDRETMKALSTRDLAEAAGADYYVSPFLKTFTCAGGDTPELFITYKCSLVPRACDLPPRSF